MKKPLFLLLIGLSATVAIRADSVISDHASAPVRTTTAIIVGLCAMAISCLFQRCQLTPVRA